MTNKITFYFISLVTSVSFISCHDTIRDHAQSGSLFIRDSLVKHIIVLASDSFQGRKPFTLGETGKKKKKKKHKWKNIKR